MILGYVSSDCRLLYSETEGVVYNISAVPYKISVFQTNLQFSILSHWTQFQFKIYFDSRKCFLFLFFKNIFCVSFCLKF